MVTIRDYSVLGIFFILVLESGSSFGYWRFSESTNGTIVSPSHIFELGLFRQERPYSPTRWYLAIWYKGLPRLPVWIANRDNPLSDSIGILKVYNSNLVLLNQSGGHVWETNLNINGAMPLVAELLDSGNFVLKYSHNRSNSDGVLWQTFHYPTDTLLPGMSLTWDIHSEPRILRSWAAKDDPSSGDYTYRLDGELGYIESEIRWGGQTLYRIDPSFTAKFGHIESEIRPDFIFNSTMQMIKNSSYFAALKLSYEGTLSYLKLTPADGDWKEIWKFPSERCDTFQLCGDNSYCRMNPLSSCKCLDGFRPMNFDENDRDHGVQKGCRRNSNLTCTDGFRRLKNMNLPLMGEGTIVQTNVEFEECRQMCFERCSNCTAFASIDIPNGGWSCVMWTENLMDVRRYNTDQGQDLYVKLAARDIGERNKIIRFIVGASILLLISVVMLCFWQRIMIAAFFVSREIPEIPNIRNETTNNWESAFMEFDVIAQATNNFSDANKIGTGGFGNVYKGMLIDRQEIAVKRLYKQSDEGIQGYFNEVNLITVLQHVNLVRLLGYFHNDNEKILVYEFIENSSLDTYLFDMVPKISDFGMAKILEGDATKAVASHLAGTIGYMSPEYISEKVYSVKSDVFSFGVLLLEIVSGMKTTEFSRLNDGQSFLSFIWRNWSEGKGLEIVDPVIKDSASSYRPEQVLQCIQIGLLCVQGQANERPPMASIVFMLGSEIEPIDLPKPPVETCSSSSHEATTSTMPMSTFVGR